MNRSGFKVLPVVFLLALSCALLPTAVLAQWSITGNAITESDWDGRATAGGAPQNGDMHVGIWNASGDVLGAPALWHASVASATPLDFTSGASYPYTIAAVPNGEYLVVAWIETDGNVQYDAGEPRSGAATVEIDGAAEIGVNVTVADDSDGDGMDDWWEVVWFLNLDEGGGTDTDVDGLSNVAEFDISQNTPALILIDPNDWDTDGDLMDDGWEYTYYANSSGTDPVVADAAGDPDGDGLLNLQEYNGIDGEGEREADPTMIGSIGRLNPQDTDTFINPILVDTDGDYLIDSFEAAWYDSDNGIDPNVAGSYNADSDQDGLTDYREQCLLAELRENAVNHDMWSLGAVSLPIVDGNGLADFSPPGLALGATAATISGDLAALRGHEWTDPTLTDGFTQTSDGGWDTDGDSLPDGWEVEYDLDPRDSVALQGGFGDPDGDTLLNIEEYRGQDGDRSATKSYVNGTGDETNPNEHQWRPGSTKAGTNVERNETMGGALPTETFGYDSGVDTDDDGIDDEDEIQGSYTNAGTIYSSPVHSMHPFIRQCALVTNAAGLRIRDPEGDETANILPDIHTRNWALECYIKTLSNNVSGYLVNMPAGVSPALPYACRLELTNDVPMITFYTVGGFPYRVVGLAVPTNEWTHIAAVWSYDNNNLALYIDGIFVQGQGIVQDAVTYETYSLVSSPTICESPDGSFVNNIMIDEVRIWGESRSAADVEKYRTILVPQDKSGLLAYYRFDDGGKLAEDFARKAQNSLFEATETDYLYADHGYAISNDSFTFVTSDYAPVRGVDPRGADDSDGDGLPDGWEMVNHLALDSSSGDDGASGDPDSDGLQNIYEFWAETNPNAEDTDQDGILDINEDHDGDGVVNGTEQTLNSRPDIVDTDDDGYADNQEQGNGSNPDNPVDPSDSLSMVFGGSTNDYLEVPNAFGQRLTDWTIEAWVNPTSIVGGVGYVVRRVVETPASGSDAVNFMMGLEDNGGNLRAYAGYSFTNGSNYMVYSDTIPVGQYTHIAASYDSLNARLTIYTNGAQSGSSFDLAYLAPPINGKGGQTFLRIGEDFAGTLDHVRIWNDVRLLSELVASYEEVVDGETSGLLHYFRFDDGQANEDMFAFSSQYHQAYGPQDFTYTNDWNEEWVHAAAMFGNVDFSQSSAILSPPQVTVVLEPPAIRTEIVSGEPYGQWNIDGGTMRDSGVQLTLDESVHSISYEQVEGWESPTNEALSLVDGQVAVLTRTYIQNGAIRRTLQPQAAIDEGARWRVDGGGWMGSGVTISNLAVSVAHLVEYDAIDDWIEPSSENVTVTAGGTDNQTRWYTTTSQSAQTTDMWGGQGIGNGEFLDPKGIVADLRYVYVADTGNDRLQKFDAFVDRWTVFATGGTGVGRFDHPMGLDLDDSGNLWVADTGNHRVQRMTPGGTWTVFGSYGTGSGQFNGPFDVAMDTDGSLYVADHYNSRVQKRTSGGVWSTVVGPGAKEGEVRYPNAVAVRDDRLVVTDYDLLTKRSRVQEFTLGGIHMRRLGSSDSMSEGMFKRPMGVCAGLTTNVYVADTGWSDLHNVYATNNWTVPLNSASLKAPEDLDLDEWGNLYIVDTGSNRVLRLNALDEDGDSLPDWVEAVVGTSTNNPDTDGDGLLDGEELLGGIDPLDPNSTFLMPISPTGTLAAAATPTLTWAPEPNSTWYYIWMTRNGSSYHSEWVSFATNWNSVAQWPGGMRSGSYQWWIRGWNPSGWATSWSSASRFEIPYYRPGKTSLISPSTRENDDDTPAFTWSTVADAQWYRLYIQDENGSSYTDLWTNTTTWTPTTSMPMGDSYIWWVRTWSGDGMGPWSSSRSLTLGKAQPVSPAGVSASPVTLTWGAAAIPSHFRPIIQNRGTGATVNPGWQAGGTTFGPTALSAGNYRWWVRTWNANGMGPWSIGVDFTIP